MMLLLAQTVSAAPEASLMGYVAIGGVLAAILTPLLTFWASHRKTTVDQKTALDERIDERVSLQLKDAWNRIDTLEQKVKELEEGGKRVRIVVRAWFQKLIRWDKGGRHGKLPVPSDEDMVTIGIEDLIISDTGEVLEVTDSPNP